MGDQVKTLLALQKIQECVCPSDNGKYKRWRLHIFAITRFSLFIKKIGGKYFITWKKKQL